MKTAFNRVIYCAVAIILILTGCAGPSVEIGRHKDLPPQPVKSYSFKKFPVLEYHLIRRPEARWSRTPENFRRDLEWLRAHNYYPFNLRDILTGFPGLPKGKIPVILTFDDSSSSQFRYLPNGEVDPECAVGIIKQFSAKYPDWPARGTFFVVVRTNNPDRNIFGQSERPEYKGKKLRQLEEWGFEVASHTYSHERLGDVSTKEAAYSLARSAKALSELTGRPVVSLALPMGLYPSDEAVFSGRYQKIAYDFKLAAEVAGGLQPAPGSADFNPLHIRRIQTIGPEWRKFFNRLL